MTSTTSTIQFHLVENEEGAGIVVVVPGKSPGVANSDHPNFNKIVEGAKAGDASVIDLFDVEQTVISAFEQLSEQVAVENGVVLFNGDPVDSSLAKQILRFLDEGEDFTPLVNFFEKVMANPNEHSRNQLYDFLNAKDFTITDSGDFVAYKGVNKQADGTLVSGFTGKARVNGEVVVGHIPQPIGGVIEMPRSEVVHAPNIHCSIGLHAGTYSYAQSYARGAMLEVWINPRDVVSVPSDSGEKLRTCRYYIVDTIDAPHSSALRSTSGYTGWGELDDEDEGDYCEDCDLLIENCECDDEDENAQDDSLVGAKYVARDSRRSGTTLTVEREDTGRVWVRSSTTDRVTSIGLDRLAKRYNRVN